MGLYQEDPTILIQGRTLTLFKIRDLDFISYAVKYIHLTIVLFLVGHKCFVFLTSRQHFTDASDSKQGIFSIRIS